MSLWIDDDELRSLRLALDASTEVPSDVRVRTHAKLGVAHVIFAIVSFFAFMFSLLGIFQFATRVSSSEAVGALLLGGLLAAFISILVVLQLSRRFDRALLRHVLRPVSLDAARGSASSAAVSAVERERPAAGGGATERPAAGAGPTRPR